MDNNNTTLLPLNFDDDSYRPSGGQYRQPNSNPSGSPFGQIHSDGQMTWHDAGGVPTGNSNPFSEVGRREDADELQRANREFDDVIRNNGEVEDHLKRLLSRHQTLVLRLFPGKMQRLINQKERLLIGEALEFRIRLLKLSNEVKMEAMRDKYDTYLKAYKGQNRLLLTECLMQQLVQLQRTVRLREMDGFNELSAMYRNASQIPGENRQRLYIAQVEQREMRFMKAIDNLMIHFENVINENLRRF